MTRPPISAPADSQNLAEREELEVKLEQVPMPCPPGYVIWRIQGTKGSTLLPQLLPHPPPRVWRSYLARVISNLTGRCPNCLQTAWVAAGAPDPERNPASWARLEMGRRSSKSDRSQLTRTRRVRVPVMIKIGD